MKQHKDNARGMRKTALVNYKPGSQAQRQIELIPVPKNAMPSAMELSIAYSKSEFSVLNRVIKEVHMKEEITNTTPGRIVGTLELQAREDFIGPMPAPKVLRWPNIPTPEVEAKSKDFELPIYQPQDAVIFTHGIKKISDQEIWSILDDYAKETPAFTGPYAITAYDRNAGKYATTQYLQDVVDGDGFNPVFIISNMTIKFVEQQIKLLLAKGIEVHYLNIKTKQYVHVPYTDLTGLDGHAIFYKTFDKVKNHDTLLWQMSQPEEPQLYIEPDPWNVVERTEDNDLPRWARSAKQLPVGWMAHYKGGLYWHKDDRIIDQPDQDTACRILPVETIPGTRQDMEDLTEFFRVLTREFLHENAEECWALWEQLGRLEDYYGEATSYAEWMKPGTKVKDKPSKPEDPNSNDSHEFATRR